MSLATLPVSRTRVFPIPVRLSASTRRIALWLAALTVVLGAWTVGSLGCERMRTAAPLGSGDTQVRTVTGYGWSLRPTGFTVRYSDGSSLTRLWW